MPDFDANFVIEIDASNVAVGVVLIQHDQPIAFMSKALNSTQHNYHTIDRELLAIVLACKRWHPCLDSKKTIVLMDHKPLIGIHTAPKLNKKKVRWFEALAGTPVQLVYWPGAWVVVPNALSHLPSYMDAA